MSPFHLLIASKTSRNDRWIPAIVVLPNRHDLDGISELVVPIRPLTHYPSRGPEWSLAMFVRPASTHKWGAQFNALAQPFGGWSVGPSCHTQPTRRWPNESSKYGHCSMQQMLLGQIFLASPVLQPPQTRYISYLAGPAGLFQQTWKVIHRTRTCDLASAVRQGCQITNFTKCKINSRNLGSTLLHKYGLVVLHQHVINFQQRHFGRKTQNISAYPRPGSDFFEDSSNAKHWAVHVGTLEFQYHLSTPWYETLLSDSHFDRVPIWWTGRNPLWAVHNACEMVRKRGENEKFHVLVAVEQLQNQLVFQIKQTICFIVVQKCGSESPSTQAILEQIRHKSYIYLEFHFSTFLRHPRSYISELSTAVLE